MNAATLQALWNTRPVRRRHGNTIAGVCTGIGDRYRVDPTLVKVAFVVAALFGGSGIIAYIAAAIAFPAEDERNPHQAAGGHGGHPWHRTPGGHIRWIPLAILAVVAMSIIGVQNSWGSSGVLGGLLMAAGWWLLYQRTPQAPAGTSADQLTDARIAAPAPTLGTVSMTKTQAPAGGVPAADSAPTTPLDQPSDDDPPSWDPLGTAKFAWDLPEPTVPPQPPTPRVPRSPITPIFLGLAVITGAAGAAVNVAGVDWFTPGRIASLVLAVLGVGLIAASFVRRRGGSGLVPIAVVAAVVAVAATGLSGVGDAFPSGGVGDRTWSPPTAGDLRDEYQLTVGSSTLDLREVGDLDRDRTIDVRQGIGEIKILLPDDLRVRTNCTAGVGEVNCTDGVVNPDAKTPTLTIDAHTAVGDVETIQ